MSDRKKPDWLPYGKQIGEAIRRREPMSPWEEAIREARRRRRTAEEVSSATSASPEASADPEPTSQVTA